MNLIAQSDIGMVRKENQDAFWICEPDLHTAFAVVCDGMGGANGGQQASKMAIEAVQKSLATLLSSEPIDEVFRQMMELSNQYVYKKAYEDHSLAGMGTTMVMALVQNGTAYFANVGDSRGYHVKNGSITQVTKDHSAVQELVDSGHITERQAKLHPNKNIITRAIGIEEEIAFDSFKVEVEPGDVLVLCSDGLSNHVDENEIQFEIAGGEFENLPKRLIELANSRGGDDNITVAAIQI